MDAEIREFLISEFETSWNMILNIDERRFKTIEYFSFIVAGTFSAVSAILVFNRDDPARYMATALLAAATFIGISFIAVLHSERTANLNYRMKINLLRGFFFEGVQDEKMLRKMLDQKSKDIGLLIDTDEQPSGLGRTLPKILLAMGIEMLLMVVGICFVWSFPD
jgi:hypothetical protein